MKDAGTLFNEVKDTLSSEGYSGKELNNTDGPLYALYVHASRGEDAIRARAQLLGVITDALEAHIAGEGDVGAILVKEVVALARARLSDK